MNNALGLDGVRILFKILCQRSSGLNVCSLNARSIRNKVDEFRYIFSNLNLHVLMVCETWLTDEVPSSFVSIPGYTLFRRDRSGRRGGGVGIYVKDCFKVRQVFASGDQLIEFISVEIRMGNEKCLLASIYCPPNSFNSESAREFENFFSHITQHYANVIIGGDFNINLCRRDNLTDQFSHFFQTLHLNTINYYPTYYSSENPSLLDQIIVVDQNKVIFHEQLSPFSTIDHDILFMAYDFPVSCNLPPRSFSYRDYINIDVDSTLQKCTSLPWDYIYSCTSVDEQVKFFTNLVLYLYDKYVPIKTYHERKSCPWFSARVRSLIKEREFLYQRYRRLRTEEARLLYKAARNKANSEVRLAKKRYYASKLNADLDTGTLWRNLRKTGVYGRDHSRCNFDPDELNASFTQTSYSSALHSSRLKRPIGRPFEP